jgi:hypothetical protein
MKSLLLRVLARERGLFVGALAIAAACSVLGVPRGFVLFGLTLAGVALFHRHALQVALIGLAVIVLYMVAFTGFDTGAGFHGFLLHVVREWAFLANLFGALLGFAVLCDHFERSRIPALLPRLLPDDWRGGFALLLMIFVLSSFLDNIAAALIGGTTAAAVFRGRVHLGFVAAIVAAANAGGSGSVVGDTTTTMMWIDGVDALDVLKAYVAAGAAVAVFGIPASLQQHRYAPIARSATAAVRIDWPSAAVVALVLAVAVAVNVTVNVRFGDQADCFPFLGAAIWAAIVLAAPWRRPDWSRLPAAFKGGLFLLSLIVSASLMPVGKLPGAAWQTALGLGFASAVFDNIPLTALALKQGGYDWGCLAYAVGFGGSMIWFGSSAGVALSNMYPQAKSVRLWLTHGWHIALSYVIGFALLLVVLGWHPGAPASGRANLSKAVSASVNDESLGSLINCRSCNARRPEQ